MKVMFTHCRVNKNTPRGGMTVAMLVDDDMRVHRAAAAACHPKDNFCRRTGRVKAEGRLKSERYSVNLANELPTLKDYLAELHTTAAQKL